MRKKYFFKTTETETITREVVYSSYGENELDAKDKMITEIKEGYYYQDSFPRTVATSKKDVVERLGALEKECVSIEKETFMNDDELKMISDVGEIYHNLQNMKNTHPEIDNKMRSELDTCDVYDIDNIQIKYYKLVFNKDLFCCPVNETLYFVEDGVMANCEDEMQLCHKSAVHECEMCGKLVENERSYCYDCEFDCM